MGSLAGAARHAGEGINALSQGLFRAGMRGTALGLALGGGIISLVFLARLAIASDVEGMVEGTSAGVLLTIVTRWTWITYRQYRRAQGGTQ